MKKIGLKIVKVILRIIYLILKLLPIEKKVIMISRQTNGKVLDFELLKKEFIKKEYKVITLCKKAEGSMISYGLHILRSMYHLATSEICIVDTYCIAVSVLSHKKALKIVQVWHSMGAVKKFGHQAIGKKEGRSEEISKILDMHKNYTYITCTSKTTQKWYSEAFNTDINKVKVWGMPRVDYIKKIKDDKEQKILEEYPDLKLKKNILYVPTFRKEQKVKIDELIESIDFEKYNLIIRLHPLDETKIDNKFKIDEKYNIYECIKIADYIITDYSAISIESSIFNKPVFFYVYDIDDYTHKRGLNVDIYSEMPDFTYKTAKQIIEKIENKKFDMKQLEKFKNKYIETVNIDNTKNIVEKLLEN